MSHLILPREAPESAGVSLSGRPAIARAKGFALKTSSVLSLSRVIGDGS
jgi:hypothetical protein